MKFSHNFCNKICQFKRIFMEEDEKDLFNEPLVQTICQEEMAKVLDGTEYCQRDSEKFTEQIVTSILQRIKTMFSPHYKYITHSTYTTTALTQIDTYNKNEWEPEKDSCITTEYNNGSVKFIVSIWALYC